MPGPQLHLDLLDGAWAVARLEPDAEVPAWAASTVLTSVTRTAHELSVVAPADRVPPGVRQEGPMRVLTVRGPLDFSAIGILAALAEPLARAGVPLLALSTFDTDVLLVRDVRLDEACGALEAAGHRIHGMDRAATDPAPPGG